MVSACLRGTNFVYDKHILFTIDNFCSIWTTFYRMDKFCLRWTHSFYDGQLLFTMDKFCLWWTTFIYDGQLLFTMDNFWIQPSFLSLPLQVFSPFLSFSSLISFNRTLKSSLKWHHIRHLLEHWVNWSSGARMNDWGSPNSIPWGRFLSHRRTCSLSFSKNNTKKKIPFRF